MLEGCLESRAVALETVDHLDTSKGESICTGETSSFCSEAVHQHHIIDTLGCFTQVSLLAREAFIAPLCERLCSDTADINSMNMRA